MVALTLLQWNARSLIANGLDFKQYINSSNERPSVICVQETWLNPRLDFRIQGYEVVRRDRVTGSGGGVAMFIKQDLSYKIVEVNAEFESVMVDVWVGSCFVRIVNFYNPCDKLSLDILEKVSGQGYHRFIWCGDFNAHSTLWGCKESDHNGRVVEEMLECTGLVCLNTGEGTRFDVARGQFSALDLTLTSGDLAGIADWMVRQDVLVGSDHSPIWCRISLDLVHDIEKVKRWNFRKANWGMFLDLCEAGVNEISFEDDVETFNNKIQNLLCKSAVKAIGKTNSGKGKKVVPWWTSECSASVKSRRKAFRALKSLHTFQLLIEFQKARAVARNVIRKAKRKYWRDFCSSLGRQTSVADVWSMIKKMGGKRVDCSIPVLKHGAEIAVSDREKAEILAKTFIAIHSNNNLTEDARLYREQQNRLNQCIITRCEDGGHPLDVEFSLLELKQALESARQTAPGKDEVCYIMLRNVSDTVLQCVLALFNKVWKEGSLPNSWKHGVVVPIVKPGKDKSHASSYRPIALTSNLCKLMEKMIVRRLLYELERRGLLSPYQSGFRKGRSTIDAVLYLESDIRKAQVSKEFVMAVFFDIEKAYDMIWKEGLLVKLYNMGIGGRLFNWIRDFLFGRTIQVRVGASYSAIYSVDNGTPQGSVCSPVLFNIMINDIFSMVDSGIGKSLYADDGALWKRGRNVGQVQKKMQLAINAVENWAFKWGFKFSVNKTQAICFTKMRNVPNVQLQMYGQTLTQVSEVKYLGVWMDGKLTFQSHINRLVSRCKHSINVMRCLAGLDWGASRKALMQIYFSLIRAAIDYGSVVYGSASKTVLQKVDKVQLQALRVCCGAFRSSSNPAILVETGEPPLDIRRQQLAMSYWVGIKGHDIDHPANIVLRDCWEHGDSRGKSFGWIAGELAQQMNLESLSLCKTVIAAPISPWLFPMPEVDLKLQNEFKKHGKQVMKDQVTLSYLDLYYKYDLKIYTDASVDPDSGRAGVSVYVPAFKTELIRRVSDYVAVYTAELVAIMMALLWVEDVRPLRTVICSDSQTVLKSLTNGQKSSRIDIIYDVLMILLRLQHLGLSVGFLWVPAHVGVEGNECADMLAKRALTLDFINVSVPLSRQEAKLLIKKYVTRTWQGMWDGEQKGRHLYKFQRLVGQRIIRGKNRQEELVLTRVRIGHCGLNQSLFRIGKHPDGNCLYCSQPETIEHVLIQCVAYDIQREEVFGGVRAVGNLSIHSMIHDTYKLIKFLKLSGLFNRI
uniref:Reverse transcriptase domain-containing protein n=1 Tax=Astyanax mexicanus TaxID=7994 RepID=A0A3B1IE94_ASTMX